jgi:hypothetical protein
VLCRINSALEIIFFDVILFIFDFSKTFVMWKIFAFLIAEIKNVILPDIIVAQPIVYMLDFHVKE